MLSKVNKNHDMQSALSLNSLYQQMNSK